MAADTMEGCGESYNPDIILQRFQVRTLGIIVLLLCVVPPMPARSSLLTMSPAQSDPQFGRRRNNSS
jgi:hypothetical protein